MRHIRLLFVCLVSTFVVTACSGAPDSSPLRRASTEPDAPSKSGGPAASHPGSSEASTQQQPTQQQPSSGTPAPATKPSVPATPLKTAVCENPTCGVSNGGWSCFAKNTEGTPVEMDCGGGVCTCFTGDQGTTQFDDENVASDGDARTLYSANCQCL